MDDALQAIVQANHATQQGDQGIAEQGDGDKLADAAEFHLAGRTP